jgi:hypothetical protein
MSTDQEKRSVEHVRKFSESLANQIAALAPAHPGIRRLHQRFPAFAAVVVGALEQALSEPGASAGEDHRRLIYERLAITTLDFIAVGIRLEDRRVFNVAAILINLANAILSESTERLATYMDVFAEIMIQEEKEKEERRN